MEKQKVIVETDEPTQDQLRRECVEEYMKTEAKLEEIYSAIQAFRDNFRDQVADLEADRDRLLRELVELTEGKPWKHPDGVAELKVKKGRMTFGKNINIECFDDPAVRAMLGPPSDYLVEVPATWKPRSMADVKKTMDLKNLNEGARDILMAILDVQVGDPKYEVKVHDILVEVEKEMEAEKEEAERAHQDVVDANREDEADRRDAQDPDPDDIYKADEEFGNTPEVRQESGDLRGD